MAKLVLEDVAAEVIQGLERRAKRLGTTMHDEASRLLSKSLREEGGTVEHAVVATKSRPSDTRFIRKDGILVFTGELPAADDVDHRQVREQRIDSFLKVS